ncbi:unnamed protein product, partial [Iphiclides podalirius]
MRRYWSDRDDAIVIKSQPGAAERVYGEKFLPEHCHMGRAGHCLPRGGGEWKCRFGWGWPCTRRSGRRAAACDAWPAEGSSNPADAAGGTPAARCTDARADAAARSIRPRRAPHTPPSHLYAPSQHRYGGFLSRRDASSRATLVNTSRMFVHPIER